MSTALVNIPAVSLPIARSLQNMRHLWHCVVHILEWPFLSRCTCVMLFNQLLDMPHLSDGLSWKIEMLTNRDVNTFVHKIWEK
jgi:hypothetical protein